MIVLVVTCKNTLDRMDGWMGVRGVFSDWGNAKSFAAKEAEQPGKVLGWRWVAQSARPAGQCVWRKKFGDYEYYITESRVEDVD